LQFIYHILTTHSIRKIFYIHLSSAWHFNWSWRSYCVFLLTDSAHKCIFCWYVCCSWEKMSTYPFYFIPPCKGFIPTFWQLSLFKYTLQWTFFKNFLKAYINHIPYLSLHMYLISSIIVSTSFMKTEFLFSSVAYTASSIKKSVFSINIKLQILFLPIPT
jgi:hypothetical protein